LKSLKQIENIEDLEIYFNIEYNKSDLKIEGDRDEKRKSENFSFIISEDLILDGSKIKVTHNNLDEYIKKRIEYITFFYKPFINEMKNGLFSVIIQ